MKKISFKKVIPYIITIAAAILLAFDYQLFIVENDFAPAGLNGVATMIQYKTGFSIGYVSLLINIPLCIAAFFLIDRKFSITTLVFCLVYSGVFLLLQKLGLQSFQYDAQGQDTIYPVILSGTISGLVYGMCLRCNSSTGGTDIVSKYISFKKPELNFFWVTFIINALVAIASFFVYAEVGEDGAIIYDYKPVCLCITYSFISMFVGNFIVKGTKTASKFTVITSHPDEITAEILEKLKHSATQVSCVGGFSHDQKSILLCVVNKHQIVDFKKILAKYEGTFAFSETINETYGNFIRVK
ncbi:MAG: YitT family protein [Clostridia bacterium]|nr:YitT family protein [Clostridia bacterium]